MKKINIDNIIDAATNNDAVKIITGGRTMICRMLRFEHRQTRTPNHLGFTFEFFELFEDKEPDGSQDG